MIEFEEFVFPNEIDIYETYNPGAIYKLWAFTINEKWICLWESNGENDNTLAEMTSNDSRIFAPSIKEIKMPTRIIRIEFNHRHLDYFTEIDGVVLKGVKYTPCGDLQQLMNSTHSNKGPIQRKLEKVSFTTVSALSNHKDHDRLLRDLETFIAKINCNDRGLSPTVVPDTDPYTLKNMPVSQFTIHLHDMLRLKPFSTQMNFFPTFLVGNFAEHLFLFGFGVAVSNVANMP